MQSLGQNTGQNSQQHSGVATFHIMPELNEGSGTAGQPSHWMQACLEAARCFRENLKVFIFTDSKELAEQLDELLWQFDPDSFVPHNLPGEGGRYGAPVEISWQAPQNQRQVLINLADRIPNFAGNFRQIIEFVPSEADKKQLARQRYRLYQQNGYQLTTANVAQADTAE